MITCGTQIVSGQPIYGGGGGSLPDTPAAVLLDAGAANQIVYLDGSGAGATAPAEVIVDTGIAETCNAVSAPTGSTLIYDSVAGATTVCAATVAALLAATALPFTSVVNAIEYTTNNGSLYHLLVISCSTSSRSYTFRGTVSATKSDYTNAYAWDIVATVSHDGSVTLRDVVITPTDPASPYAVAVDVNGSNLRVNVTGVAMTSVKWHAGGFLTTYGA